MGQLKRHHGPNKDLPARSSPYPRGRLAPVHDLIDIASEIAAADRILETGVHAKLELIAEQIRYLQAKARSIMEEAREDADLHRASCSFSRRVGETYHLYRRESGEDYFSMLSPQEWGEHLPHQFRGSYRLERDMSWCRVDQTPR